MKTTLLSAFFCFALFTSIAQPDNNFCQGAIVLDEEFLAEFCVDDGWRNIDVSLAGALTSPNLSGCVLAGAPSVWYVIPATDTAYLLSFKLSGVSSSAPAMQIFRGDCDSLEFVSACAVNYFDDLFVMDIPAEASNSYYIVLGDAADQSDSLRFHWSRRNMSTPCVTIQNLRPVYRSGDQPVTGPFFAGDTIGFNYTVYFQVSTGPQSCQWMQGVVPVFGSGWDVSSFTPSGEPSMSTLNGMTFPAPNVENDGTWRWWNDVHYHFPNCNLSAGDFDGNGTFDMCDRRYDPECSGEPFIGGCCGPCWQEDDGDLLPAGWFSSDVNGSCGAHIGWPAVDWGDGGTCNGLTGPWDFYFELVVPIEMTTDHGDFSIVMHTFADGETGSWTGGPSACAADYPARYDAPVMIECLEEEGIAYLNGFLFADFESDCSYDGNEPGVPYKVIALKSVISGETELVLTASDGHFLATIDTGTYWIVPVLDGVEPEQCPDSVLLAITNPCEIYELSFPVDNDLLCTEVITMHMTSGALRICEPSMMTITVRNGGGIDLINPTILVELDTLLEFESANGTYEALGDNMFLFHLPNIVAGAERYIRIRVKTSCDAPFGFLHCSNAKLINVVCTMEEVSGTWCWPNGVAIDPNFKIDASDFSFGITEIIDDSEIEYQIHFQNTGTSYAKRVTIRDTLPVLIDPSTFVFKGSSHEVEIFLIDNHILEFFFDNIFLPDSTTDEAGSHGVVVFEIQPVKNLVIGDSFLNSASIYFDFAAPVITNQKQHLVACETAIVFDSISLVSDNGTGVGAVYLFADAGSGYSYTWSNGETTSSIVNVDAGDYTVTVTNADGCLSIFTFTVLLNTAVTTPNDLENMFLTPNPAGNLLNMHTPDAQTDFTVEILSMTGVVVSASQKMPLQEIHQIDISQLLPGIYLCRVRTDTDFKLLRFVKG